MVQNMWHATKKHTKGFSLIELIVAVSILATISIITLANHARFNGSVLLGSLAYDIALSVREAQVFGVSVRQYNDNFQLGYGIRFADVNSYNLFADTNSNGEYDETDTIIRNYALQRGFRVTEFCGTTSSGMTDCSTDSSDPITHLAIVFLRPEPDAYMSSNVPGAEYSYAYVTIQSPGGDTRSVEVASTGQIAVLRNNQDPSGGGGGGGGEPTFTWQATGANGCFQQSPTVSPGGTCSTQGAIGYVNIAGQCFFGFAPRHYDYRCDP